MTKTPESGEDPLFHFLFLCPCYPEPLPNNTTVGGPARLFRSRTT